MTTVETAEISVIAYKVLDKDCSQTAYEVLAENRSGYRSTC